MESRSEGFALVLMTACISGISIFINKFGVSASNPYMFTTIKNAVVTLLFLSLVLLTKERKKLKTLSRAQWKNLLAIGCIGGSVPFLLFFKGLSLTSSAQAGFIHKTLFIYATLLSILFLKEKVSRAKLLSSLALLGGLSLLIGIPAPLGEGDFLVLAATLLWAGENVLSRHALKSIPASIVVLGRMGFGLLILVPFVLLTGSAGTLSFSPEALAWTGVTSLFLFGYVFTYYHGLKRIQVSEATSVLLLGSALTTLLNAVFITGALSLNALSGILLLVFGAGLTLGLHKVVIRCVSPLKAR